MAVKHIELPEIGAVRLYKRRGSRSVRLSVAHNGEVRVTLPSWLPYQAGIKFAHSKAKWIAEQRQKLPPDLQNGQAIGKAHHLQLNADQAIDKIRTSLKGSVAAVYFPATADPSSADVQKAARSVSIRALRREAEELLPKRLQSLAKAHNFTYGSVTIRQLKGRWGSCSQHSDITLNLFLMQLPWELIDYVILHELTHTKVMRHGPPFWGELEKCAPNARELRKAILTHRPAFD